MSVSIVRVCTFTPHSQSFIWNLEKNVFDWSETCQCSKQCFLIKHLPDVLKLAASATCGYVAHVMTMEMIKYVDRLVQFSCPKAASAVITNRAETQLIQKHKARNQRVSAGKQAWSPQDPARTTSHMTPTMTIRT